MCVGQGRVYETACVLAFDHNIKAKIDQTLIVTPYNESDLKQWWSTFDIDYSTIKFIADSSIQGLHEWRVQNWYLQQAFKLHLLDTVDSDYFLIQDSDVFCIQPYTPFIDSKPCFRVDELWNPYQQVYADGVKQLTGYNRAIPYSFVTELMPYTKTDWLQCKSLIDPWQTKISETRAFDDTHWFSEYELLGIIKTNLSSDYTISKDFNIGFSEWGEIETTDWRNIPTVKFRARPLKFMTQDQAHWLIKFFKHE
jgi:hypothetical protein